MKKPKCEWIQDWKTGTCKKQDFDPSLGNLLNTNSLTWPLQEVQLLRIYQWKSNLFKYKVMVVIVSMWVHGASRSKAQGSPAALRKQLFLPTGGCVILFFGQISASPTTSLVTVR